MYEAWNCRNVVPRSAFKSFALKHVSKITLRDILIASKKIIEDDWPLELERFFLGWRIRHIGQPVGKKLDDTLYAIDNQIAVH